MAKLVSVISYLCIEWIEDKLVLYGREWDDIFSCVTSLYLVDMVTH